MSDNSDSDDSERSSQNQNDSDSDSEIILNDMDKRLLDAAEGGTSEDVQRLIQEGADILAVDDRSVFKS